MITQFANNYLKFVANNCLKQCFNKYLQNLYPELFINGDNRLRILQIYMNLNVEENLQQYVINYLTNAVINYKYPMRCYNLFMKAFNSKNINKNNNSSNKNNNSSNNNNSNNNSNEIIEITDIESYLKIAVNNYALNEFTQKIFVKQYGYENFCIN